jgi:hypothetical protein
LHVVEELFVLADDAELEVAAAGALRAKAGAGPVRAPEVQEPPVDDDRLQVDPRTHPKLEPARDQARVAVELVAEGPGRIAGMKDPELDTAPRERGKGLDHRAVGTLAAPTAPALLDHQLLQVGGRDPDAGPRRHHRLDHRLVMRPARDEAERHCPGGPREVHRRRL